jgi:ankyrin repeat protein
MTTLFDEDLTFEIAKELIKNGADVNYQSEGYTPLFFVKTIDVAQLLIDHGADVNAKDIDGHTPLHNVSDTNIAILLINHGADTNAIDHNTFSPLYYHILYSNKDIVLFLIEILSIVYSHLTVFLEKIYEFFFHLSNTNSLVQ